MCVKFLSKIQNFLKYLNKHTKTLINWHCEPIYPYTYKYL